ncbi:MAG: response regulator [Myxococcales bacterium]|nr:response regulator [Myxococcales bacterium]
MVAAYADPGAARPVILVVEDDFDTRRMMATMLAPLGEVRTACDGEEALELLLDERPDLIVTDVMMPKLDGFELSRFLKADPALSRIPILVVTARNLPRDVVEGINAGARYYMTKPFSPHELVQKARRALER